MATVKELDERVTKIEELLGIIPTTKILNHELPPVFNTDERVNEFPELPPVVPL